jgi:hypothetical protein
MKILFLLFVTLFAKSASFSTSSSCIPVSPLILSVDRRSPCRFSNHWNIKWTNDMKSTIKNRHRIWAMADDSESVSSNSESGQILREMFIRLTGS